jgi:hypothetical protein
MGFFLKISNYFQLKDYSENGFTELDFGGVSLIQAGGHH